MAPRCKDESPLLRPRPKLSNALRANRLRVGAFSFPTRSARTTRAQAVRGIVAEMRQINCTGICFGRFVLLANWLRRQKDVNVDVLKPVRKADYRDCA